MKKNDTILILGASSNVGWELMRQLATETTRILAHHSRSDSAKPVLPPDLPGQIIPLQADFQDLSSTLALVETISRKFGCPDKIVHLPAPKLTYVRFKAMAWEAFQASLDIQLRSLFYLLKQFLPEMAKSSHGKVVLMLSSVTLNVPPKNLAHYCTAKYALLGLMRALAAEYAEKGIAINAVSPSMMETEFLSLLPPQVKELAADQNPRKRNVTPGEVAKVIRFLLAEETDFLTGINIPITGGESF